MTITVAGQTTSAAPEPGVYKMPFADYIRLPAVNWHTIEPMRISAKNCRTQLLAPDDANSAMMSGDALHAAVLEPERFETDYVCMPVFDGHPNSNAHKAAKAEWLESHRDKVCLTRGERGSMQGMAEAVRNHPIASRLVHGRGRNEFVIVWKDKETGLLCKGRVDRLCEVDTVVLNPAARAGAKTICLPDLKSTRDVGLKWFDGEIGRRGYHGQLAFYHDGLQTISPAPMSVLIIAIQNDPPFDVAVRLLEADSLEDGRRLYRRLLNGYSDCQRTGRWPGVAEHAVPVVLPKYLMEQEAI